MTRKACSLRRILCLGVLCVALVCGSAHYVVGHGIGDDQSLHAQAPVVLRVELPGHAKITSIGLEISGDGSVFRKTKVGIPKPWLLLRSLSSDDQRTIVLVPLVGEFDTYSAKFLFELPGRYFLRWRIRFAEEGTEVLQIDQTVEVLTPRRPDLDFLRDLDDRQFQQNLRGKSIPWPEDAAVPANYLALDVIKQLMGATRERVPMNAASERGSLEEALRWADTLQGLAKAHPDSGYAPYAAYYAGCCYLTSVAETVKEVLRQDGVDALSAVPTANTHYANALRALTMAAENGDPYLRPRALHQLAWHAAWGGKLKESELLLDRALEAAGAKGAIEQWVNEFRRDLQRRSDGKPQSGASEPGE